MSKKSRTMYLAESAVIAALYAVLSYLSAGLNLAFGAVQFRLSDALCVLPLFTPSAVPGLAVGCFISNLVSPLGIIDWVFGTLATLLAALCTRKLRDITLFSIPFFSVLMPVIFNGFIVGFELACLNEAGAFNFGFFNTALYLSSGLSVAFGETVVLAVLGIPLILLLKKSKLFGKFHK